MYLYLFIVGHFYDSGARIVFLLTCLYFPPNALTFALKCVNFAYRNLINKYFNSYLSSMFLRGVSKALLYKSKAPLNLYEQNLYCFGSIKKFVLPDLGESKIIYFSISNILEIKEAIIKKWHVKEGDIVEEVLYSY